MTTRSASILIPSLNIDKFGLMYQNSTALPVKISDTSNERLGEVRGHGHFVLATHLKQLYSEFRPLCMRFFPRPLTFRRLAHRKQATQFGTDGIDFERHMSTGLSEHTSSGAHDEHYTLSAGNTARGALLAHG